MDTEGREWDLIENYLLEEDKSVDPLDDEEFPGFLYTRIKLYSKDPTDSFPKDLFPKPETYQEVLLQIHLYMGRNLPSADETGAADPFMIVRCMG